MPSDIFPPGKLCRHKLVCTVLSALDHVEEPSLKQWRGFVHTCDHQTSSLGTKAVHERCFAFGRGVFQIETSVVQERKTFPLRLRTRVTSAEVLLMNFCFSDSDGDVSGERAVCQPKLPFFDAPARQVSSHSQGKALGNDWTIPL
jgi:hypothetical protein